MERVMLEAQLSPVAIWSMEKKLPDKSPKYSGLCDEKIWVASSAYMAVIKSSSTSDDATGTTEAMSARTSRRRFLNLAHMHTNFTPDSPGTRTIHIHTYEFR